MRRTGRVLALVGVACMAMSGSARAQMFNAGIKGGTAVTSVPLLVRFRVPINSRTPVHLFGGPNFGIKLGSSATLQSSTTLKAPGKSVAQNINPALKTLDLGFAVGAGIERGQFLYEGRFTGGITDIAAASFPHVNALRNRTFSVMVGRKFR